MTFALTSPALEPRLVCTISECGLYRYELGQFSDETRAFDVHFLANPSRADFTLKPRPKWDATSLRVRGFGQRDRRGGWVIVNPYAFRSRNPRSLLQARDPIGPENRSYVARWFLAAHASGGKVIVGWGAALPKALRDDARDLASMTARDVGCQLWCYGLTVDSQPRHPLFLAADSPLVRFVP